MGARRAIDEAAKLLCAQRIRRLKINPLQLNYASPIHFETIQRYCERTRQSRAQLISGSGSSDGLAIIRKGKVPIVLYNEKAPLVRRMFTIAHEVGHVRLGHLENSPENESEADMFAANLLLPRILLREMIWMNSTSDICTVCLVSKAAANLQLQRLPKSADDFSNAERELLKLYKPLLLQPHSEEPQLDF